MASSSGYTLPISRRGHQILPKAYDKSERLDLDFWDPRRLAAHVLATLSPADQRGKAADLILERQITGSFLARYTRQIEELLDGEGDSDCELIRAIARTVSKTFWVPFHEPRAFGRYDTLREIVKDLQRGASCVEDGSSSVAGSAAVCSAFEKEEEEEEDVELHELVEEGAELTEDEIRTRERQDNDDAGCGGGREEGGTSGAGDGERDRDGINYYDLRSLLAKIELAICPDFRSSATRVFWDYTTQIFGLSRRG